MPRVIFVFLILIFSFDAFSASTATRKSPRKSRVKKMIDANIEISKGIEKAATTLDEGLAGKKMSGKPNNTQFVIRNQFNWAEGGNYLYQPHFDLKLHLPNLEEKIRLQFSTADQEQESRGINRSRLKTQPTRTTLGGGVGVMQKLGDINAEFQPRVEYRDQVFLSYLLKFGSKANLWSPNVALRPELQLFARSDSGLAEFFSTDCDFALYKTLVLTLVNEEQYVDRDNIFSTNHGLILGFDYSDKVSQSISYIFESSSRPNFHLDRYTAAIGVTHRLYKNVLHYTIMPYMVFPRNLDYKGSPGIGFELDIIF